jgi:membrane-bound lytic murein transglycosylase B
MKAYMKNILKTLTLFTLAILSLPTFANNFAEYDLAMLENEKIVPAIDIAIAVENKTKPEDKKVQKSQETKPTPTAEEDVSEKFKAWKQEFRKRAIEKGIKNETLDKVFARITYVHRAVAKDKNQPEVKFSFDKYKNRMINDYRINQGYTYFQKHRPLIEKISKEYKVQSRFIIALWGLESSYGYNIGTYFIPEVLATLAFEGRRGSYFEGEFIGALKIIQDGMIDINHFKGSWAGAFGQSQFMPTTYLAYAVDYNKDGKKDLYGTPEDIFASIANYLRFLGWDDESTWGRKVRLPEGFDIKANHKATKAITEWRNEGLLKDDGKKLPRTIQPARLIIFDEDKNNAYFSYDNFKLIKKWNNSDSFATVVGVLSDAIENKDKEMKKLAKEAKAKKEQEAAFKKEAEEAKKKAEEKTSSTKQPSKEQPKESK